MKSLEKFKEDKKQPTKKKAFFSSFSFFIDIQYYVFTKHIFNSN